MTLAVFTGGRVQMSKQEQRAEAERLMREAMERKGLSVKTGDTKIETKCGKCGAVNKASAAQGTSRIMYKCKECGHEQRAI